MEDIFSVKSIPWVKDDVINFKEYFEKYYSVVNSVLKENTGNSRDDIRKSFPPHPSDDQHDPFDVDRLEAACSPDLLTVKNELVPQTMSDFPSKDTARMSNWYTGKFTDTSIPEEGRECLQTLSYQAAEHQLREQVADYSYLRSRQFKYSSVFRMINDTSQDNSGGGGDGSGGGSVGGGGDMKTDEILINVKIHRPYYRNTVYTKSNNAFPKCSQELLVLGSHTLTDLRDKITCINSHAISRDVSTCPRLTYIPCIPTAASEFPSSFLYINGVFYSDSDMCEGEDHTLGIKTWARKRNEIGPLVTKRMEHTLMRDVELRLGYPYVFVHLANCEHIVVFTDARLLHRGDPQVASLYPVTRGQSVKLTTKCQICNLYLANWLVKGDPSLPMEFSLLCEVCLKTYCFDNYGKKSHTLKVIPYKDE